MTKPAKSELSFYTNTPLDESDWSVNFLKIIEWLTDGTYDLTIGTLTMATLTVSGNVTVTGTVTAASFVGDGSALTGLEALNKNYIVNGLGQVDLNGADYTLVKDTYGTRANKFDGMATGTAVSAGDLTVTDTANIGRTGRAIEFNGVTLTGSGEIHLRTRIKSSDAVKMKGQNISYQALVYHDVGSAINYVVYFRKANTKDDFSAVTAIADTGNVAVADTTSTQLTKQDLAIGDVTNGLEIEIVASAGAVTTKSFEFTEMQIEVSAAITSFEYRPYQTELNLVEGAETLKIKPPTAVDALTIDQNNNKSSIEIDSEATSDTVLNLAAINTSGTVVNIDNQGNQASGDLVKIVQDNASSAADALHVQNDGTGVAINIDQNGAGIGLNIAQAGDEIGLKVDSEATSAGKWGILANGKFAIEAVQDISSGRGLSVTRNINEAGSLPLVRFLEDHASGTQPVLEIQNDGSGEEIKFTNAVTRVHRIDPADMGENATDDANAGWSCLIIAGGITFATGFHLPEGAIITRFDVWGYSTNQAGVQDATFDLRRNDLDANTEDDIAQVVLSWGDAEAASFKTGNDTSITNATIVDGYSYHIFASAVNAAGGYPVFKGAKISYTIAEPLP